MHTVWSAKTTPAAHHLSKKLSSKPNNKRNGAKVATIHTGVHVGEGEGTDGYISFDDVQQNRHMHVKLNSHRGEENQRCRPRQHHQQQGRQASCIILNTSLSDDSSSLTTIADSLTTLDGLNIDLSSPCDRTRRSRSVRCKKVSFLHTYNASDHPGAINQRARPSTIRKLGLYEKIALYEQRPDLAPFYYVGGRLPSTSQTVATPGSLGFDNEELVLAPLDEARDFLQIGRKPTRTRNSTPTMEVDEAAIKSAGSTDAVANFMCRDDVPYDEDETRDQNNCEHRRVDTLSLLDTASGSDSRDDDDDDDGDAAVRNVRDECPIGSVGGDVTRLCRIYGPRAVESILGCVAQKS